MGFRTGSLDPVLAREVTALEKLVLERLQRCCDVLRAQGNGPDAALMRWFGDATPGFRKDMKEKVAKMRSVLNNGVECITDKTTIYYTDGTGNQVVLQAGDPTENAEARHFTGGVFQGSEAQRVTKMTSQNTYIKIGPNFKNLPSTAGGAVGAWVGQDKLETLLHELSHYVHGTHDRHLNGGATAYGAQAARQLVTQAHNPTGKSRAKDNAENWGFFIEECGL
jgi:hypothetical protein